MDCTHQASLSMGFPRPEYWSGLPFPFPGDLYESGIKPQSPVLASRFFTTEPPGKPLYFQCNCLIFDIPLLGVLHMPVCLCVRLALLVCFVKKQKSEVALLAWVSQGNSNRKKCIKRKDFLNLRERIYITPYERVLVSCLEHVDIQWTLLWVVILWKQWFYCSYLNIGYI